MSRKICLAGGGTGGHLVPNLALYKVLLAKKSCPYFYITNNEFDRRFCSSRGVEARILKFGKLASGGFFFVVAKVLFSIIEVGLHFLLERPHRVVGSGGYGSFPMYFCAVLLRIPLFIVEPNHVCGKVNRWFAPYARKIFTVAKNIRGLERQTNLVVSGNPLPYDLLSNEQTGSVLLVFGASQGASVINEFMASWLSEWREDLPFRIVWITGSREYLIYKPMQVGDGIEIIDFHDNMELLYKQAALVICRAGAGTVAELKTFRVPAILVPYPHHGDRQQYLNSEDLVSSGACLMVEETEFEIGPIREMVMNLFKSPEALTEMRANFPDSPNPLLVREGIANIILEN